MFSKYLPNYRTKTVLRPDFPSRRGAEIVPMLHDYRTVACIDANGTHRVVDLLDFEVLAKLSILRDKLNK